jgi:hypothetical protein
MVEAVLKHTQGMQLRRVQRLLGVAIAAAGSIVLLSKLMGLLS